jgi:uncharacterized membrane protein
VKKYGLNIAILLGTFVGWILLLAYTSIPSWLYAAASVPVLFGGYLFCTSRARLGLDEAGVTVDVYTVLMVAVILVNSGSFGAWALLTWIPIVVFVTILYSNPLTKSAIADPIAAMGWKSRD